MNIKNKGRLLQIIKHCNKIEDKISNIEKEEFDDNEDIREIICFNIFQIGELTKGLSDEFIKEYNKQPWKEIKVMRDRIGHGYDTIDIDIVWNTARTNIKELNKYIKYIIADDYEK